MYNSFTRYAFSKVKPNVEPTLGLLRTLTVCLWASMMCLTIAKPSPEPPWSRERLLSTL